MPITTTEEICLQYADDIISGKARTSKWVYAQALRFMNQLKDPSLVMDWDEAHAACHYINNLHLVGECWGKPFTLQPWQAWIVSQVFGLKNLDGHRVTKLAIIQVARGAGKTTMAAAMLLYELSAGGGRQCHSIANSLQQAILVQETMKQMINQMTEENDFKIGFDTIDRKEKACRYTPLTTNERSLDGLNPSLWVADEAAEYKGRYLSKLLTTAVKRGTSTGVIVTTPGDHTDSHYSEIISNCHAILNNEMQDNTVMPFLFGLDPDDQIEDETVWIKANPGIPCGQPSLLALQRQFQTLKRTPAQRRDFERYHCCREAQTGSSWLDMSLYSKFIDDSITYESLQGMPAWIGVDLSKSRDMSSVCVAVPLPNGKVYLKSYSFWPSITAKERELDFRLPLRDWVSEGHLSLCVGAEIDYHQILNLLSKLCAHFSVQSCGYDQWGSKMFAEVCYNAGIPMASYSMGISTLGPGTQILQQQWYNQNLVLNTNPILKQAFADVGAKSDSNGNIRPIKARKNCVIDPVMAAIIALHVSGAGESSIYNIESNARKAKSK
jgi:phage terminase large subunit-like protein